MSTLSLITKKLEIAALFIPGLAGFIRIYYRFLVAKEINLGKICPCDRVLCIGGGPLPCTALEIAEKTGAMVQVIDNDTETVKIARKMVHRVDLEDRVSVDYGEGQKVDASNYTVIHVALQAQPHGEILDNIWCKASAGTRIMIRVPGNKVEIKESKLAKSLSQCRKSIIRNTILYTKIHGRRQHEKMASWHDSSIVNNRSYLAG